MYSQGVKIHLPCPYETLMKIRAAFPLKDFVEKFIKLSVHLKIPVCFGSRLFDTELRLKELRSQATNEFILLPEIETEMLDHKISPDLAVAAFQTVIVWFMREGIKPKLFQILNLRSFQEKEAAQFPRSYLKDQIQQLIKRKVIAFK